METDKHYFTVGLWLAILCLTCAFFTVWLVTSGQESDERYRIYFAESVSGLSEGSPVKYRGVSVGAVASIHIDSTDSRLIRVDVKVRQDTPVKVDTMAALKLQGITGTVYIELSAGDPHAKDIRDVAEKGTVPVIPSQASSITAIMNQMPQIMDRLASFAEQMNKLTSDDNLESLKTVLDNIAASSTQMRGILHDTRDNIVESSEQVSGTMQNLRRATRNVNIVTERVKDDPSSLLFPPEEEGIPAP